MPHDFLLQYFKAFVDNPCVETLRALQRAYPRDACAMDRFVEKGYQDKRKEFSWEIVDPLWHPMCNSCALSQKADRIPICTLLGSVSLELEGFNKADQIDMMWDTRYRGVTTLAITSMYYLAEAAKEIMDDAQEK